MEKLILQIALGLTLATLLSSCGINGLGTDVSCQVFAPIKFSRHDTAETIQALIEFNEVWSSLCV